MNHRLDQSEKYDNCRELSLKIIEQLKDSSWSTETLVHAMAFVLGAMETEYDPSILMHPNYLEEVTSYFRRGIYFFIKLEKERLGQSNFDA